jgi:hypothetical protein
VLDEIMTGLGIVMQVVMVCFKELWIFLERVRKTVKMSVIIGTPWAKN